MASGSARVRRTRADVASRLLAVLGEYDQPVGVVVVARRVGRHTNTVREHLNALVSTGSVARSRVEPIGRGRPSWGYLAAAPSAGDRMPARGTATAGHALNAQVDAAAGHSVVSDTDEPGVAVDSGDDLLDQLLLLLGQLGYQPRIGARADQIVLHANPLAASDHGQNAHGLSAVHRRVLRLVVGQLGGNTGQLTVSAGPPPALANIVDIQRR